MNDPLTFDSLAEEVKETALRSLERNTDPAWLASAYDALVDAAQAQEAVTSDDVWERLALSGVEPPHDSRAMANVFLRGKAGDVVRATDRMVRSRRPSRHTARVMVWRSLVHAREALR